VKPMSFRNMRIVGTSIAVIAIAGSAMIAAAAPGATAPPRWLVFTAHPNGGAGIQLFRIRTTGTGLAQITAGRLPAVAPTFAPSGERVAFTRLGSGIFSVNVDGSGLRRLTSNGRDSYPAWSPDGKQIAFLRPYKAQWRVFTVPAGGGKARRLPQGPPAGRPSWAPDSKGILIPSAADLVKIDARTGRALKYYGMTLDVDTVQSVAVSPDNRRVAYVGPRRSTGPEDCGDGPCPQYGLYLANVPAPHRARRIVDDTGPAGWSPDGKSLVFVAKDLLTLRPVGGGAVETIGTDPHVPAGDSPPAWQPR
jgi:Tol biopolymer transport system component